MNSPIPVSQFRSRLILILIAAMFLSSFAIAAFLRFSGWQPAHSKNFGELLQPPRDLTAQKLLRADGQPYDWNPGSHTWRIVAVAPADCADACAGMLNTLQRVWFSQGRHAEQIDVLWFGALPKGAPGFRKLFVMQANAALFAALPEATSRDAMPVYLIDPEGFLVMHYRAGFDPSGLRKDLGKLAN